MAKELYIIASCTDRKRRPVPPGLRLRHFNGPDLSERAKSWWQQLSRSVADSIPASELYGGDHWSIAKALPELGASAGYRCHLWVASAGYGLIPASAPLRPYSATFSSGHADSVSRRVPEMTVDAAAAVWWARLNAFSGPTNRGPRSIEALTAENRKAAFLVIGSAHYIAAMRDDLVSGAHELQDASRLMIVSTTSQFDDAALEPHLIPCDARIQSLVGGPRSSLHARVARKLLAESHRWELSAEVLRLRYQRLLATAPQVKEWHRDRMSDQDILKHVEAQLRADPDASHSSLLRALRRTGRACGQGRFRRLFLRARGKKHAS